ncbi:MAG: YkgJ family cysteine cluster protein [Thermoanaerobaculia bacterium]|nr:YkgJ family cysteine cluster protein [Thermoanaerobaculia bacterium]
MTSPLVVLDRRLMEAVDSAGSEARRLAGEQLACRLGCTACCHGPFPIDALDADRLRRGLLELTGRDAERAEQVRERARQALEVLRPGFPGQARAGHLDTESSDLDAYLTRHSEMPCPALDPLTGGCDLYSHRPLACRTFGPPVTLAGTRLDPCALCFVGADPQTLEACRVAPDLSAEAPAFDELAKTGIDPDVETLVAFVLAD